MRGSMGLDHFTPAMPYGKTVIGQRRIIDQFLSREQTFIRGLQNKAARKALKKFLETPGDYRSIFDRCVAQ
jgi:hypothetical protein